MPCSPHIQQQSPILTRFPASVQSHHKFPEACYTISPQCNPDALPIPEHTGMSHTRYKNHTLLG